MRKGGNLKWGVGAGVFALIFLACLSGTARGDEMKALRPLIGKGEKAPAFTLDTLEGKPPLFSSGGGETRSGRFLVRLLPPLS